MGQQQPTQSIAKQFYRPLINNNNITSPANNNNNNNNNDIFLSTNEELPF